MTKRRDLSNTVKWALEDIYSQLEQADHLLAKLMDESTTLTRTGIISMAARATCNIRMAREHVVSVHPSVRAAIHHHQGGGHVN